jgi:hypothetical protein
VLTLAFALRRDVRRAMAWVYFVVQFIAAACGSLLAPASSGPPASWRRRYRNPACAGRRPEAEEAGAAQGIPLRQVT